LNAENHKPVAISDEIISKFNELINP
jgi:hypothetical protein